MMNYNSRLVTRLAALIGVQETDNPCFMINNGIRERKVKES